MKTITLSFFDNRRSTYEVGTVYGYIPVNPESAVLMRKEFRSSNSIDGMEFWTLEQVASLTRTLDDDTQVLFVK